MAQAKPEHILDQEEMEGRILHGLAREWEASFWVLSPHHRQRIRPPLFSLRDMKTRWGTWDARKREISLSRDLVLQHSWDSVREVLLHEMAHQFAAEVLGAEDESAHGPRFLQACFLLRANPRASAKYRPLDERVFREGSPNKDKRLLRVKKLLALAGSPNQHEAEAAMAKAHELMARFNLGIVEEKTPRDFESVFTGRPLLRHPAEDYYLAGLIQDFYFVRCMWVSAFVFEKDRMGRVLEISGTPQNVRLGSYVYDFVRNFIESQWSLYNRGRTLNRFRKTDFAIGIVQGFRSKLESHEEVRTKTPGGNALVALRDPLLEQYMAFKYPRVTTVRRGSPRQDRKVLKAGQEAGRNMVIHKGIEEKGCSKKALTGNMKLP